jgi:RNA polymerase sigma-70 factor, ECF subfamily
MNTEIYAIRQKYIGLDQHELILKCQTGDMLALEELVKRNQKIVYSILYHLLPDQSLVYDLSQEALFRMCKSIKNLRTPATFKVWLNQIVTNLVYDELRKKKKRLTTVSLDAPFNSEDDNVNATRDIVDTTTRPDEKLLTVELDDKIKLAIQNLPEHFRTAIVYRELLGLSYEEIAQATDTNIGTVKSRIARARTRLQEDLKPYLK